jgi:hypothetical protein
MQSTDATTKFRSRSPQPDKRKALQERRNGLAAQKEFLAAENG